jgi:hypothetical protein
MGVFNFRPIRVLVLVAAVLSASGCDNIRRFVNRDLAFSYQSDPEGRVDRASVDSDTRVIASATRVAVRSTSDSNVTEIDVDETHFVRGTLTVVYTGRIVFQCKVGEMWCLRTGEVPSSGARPRDVFRKWPVTFDALRHGYPL